MTTEDVVLDKIQVDADTLKRIRDKTEAIAYEIDTLRVRSSEFAGAIKWLVGASIVSAVMLTAIAINLIFI